MPGMAVELESMRDDFTTPSGFEVRQVRDLGVLRDFVDVASTIMNLFMGQTYEFFRARLIDSKSTLYISIILKLLCV
jgi:hypothetical protein